MLALVFALLAGMPQDRFATMPHAETSLSAHGASGHSHAAGLVAAAMADPEDGLDEASRSAIPVLALSRAATRIEGIAMASAESSATIRFERPPRIAL